MVALALARRTPTRRPPPIATDALHLPLLHRFVTWRQSRAAAAAAAAAGDGTAPTSPPSPPPPPSSRRGAVVDPSGTDYFLGPGVAASPPQLRREQQQEVDREAERRLYRKVEAAPTPAAAVAECLAALAAAAPVGVEPLCLALFRGAVAVSDGEAIVADDGEEQDEETGDDDADAGALRRLQRALAAELSAATAPAIKPSDAANVLWALASEACSRGRPAGDWRAVEALAAAAAASVDGGGGGDDDAEEHQQQQEQWQTADLVSALWGAGTLLRALGSGRQRSSMPATQALVRSLGAALAQRWEFGAGGSGASPSSSRPSSPAPQYPHPPPRPRPCAEDLADAAAGVAAAAAATAASAAAASEPQPLLNLLESISSCLHAALCNRHSGGALGGSGGAAPGAADTAKLFSSLASAALALSSEARGGWRSAVPSLPRALDALAALASQRARDRHRLTLSRPAHLAAAAKALADLGHGSLAVPELLRLLGREAALGAAGADGLAPPTRSLTLAERQAMKAAALSSSSSSDSDEEEQLSLPPEVAPPTARWRPREAADLLGAMLRLGYQPPRLMCSAVAAAVLKGLREEDGGDEDDDDEAASAAAALLAAFAEAGWHPGGELAEKLFSRAITARGGGEDEISGSSSSNERLADLLHAWAVLMAASASASSGGGSNGKGRALALQAAEALCENSTTLPARSAVRALWSLAALGQLTPQRFALLAERALAKNDNNNNNNNNSNKALSDAQLAAVAEAAMLVGAAETELLSPADLARCERALRGERAEALHRASRLSSFSRDADALSARLLLAQGESGGWRRLGRDLAAWARAGGEEDQPHVLLLLADEEGEGGGCGDEAGTSALDHRAGGGLLPGGGPLGGLVLRARLARQEALDAGLLPPSSLVMILPRREAVAVAAEGQGDDAERVLLARALPLTL